MKQLISLLVLCTFLLPAQSQNQVPYSNKKNEINIGYFNAFNLSSIPEIGVGYKRYFKTGALRFSAGWYFLIMMKQNLVLVR